MNAQQLAQILAEELRREQWADVPLHVLFQVAAVEDPTSLNGDGRSLAQALERTIERLSAFTSDGQGVDSA